MPVQLFHGDNLLELGEAVRVLRDRFHPADVLTFEGSDVTLSKLSEACLTAGLFDPDRLVIVRDLHERIRGARKESPELEELTRDELIALVPEPWLFDRMVPAGLFSKLLRQGLTVRVLHGPARPGFGKAATHS